MPILMIAHRLSPVMRTVVWSILGLGPSRIHIGSFSRDVGLSLSELEWACCALGIGLAFLVRSRSPHFCLLSKLPRFGRHNRRAQVALTFAISVLARLLMLGVEPVPVPLMHDELSNLLAADTFAHGRLTNTTPPAWQHFETYQVLLRPSYMSKYPPAQGLFLGFGQALFGTPFAGVIIECALMCAALCWFLQSFMPPRWAFLGGLIAVLRLSLISYWVDSYWGGAVAAFAGCLLLGGIIRLVATWKYQYGILVGVALFLLANSRPFEGFVFSIVPIGYLIVKGYRVRSSETPAFGIVALVATSLAGALWTGYYNFKVTGSAASLPQSLHMKQYSSTPPLLFLPLTPLAHPENVSLQKNDYSVIEEAYWHQARTSVGSYFSIQIARTMDLWTFFCGPALSLGFLGIGRAISNKRLRLFSYVAGLMVITQLFETWFHPHYAAPSLGIIYVLLLTSMRYIGTWRRGHRTGMVLVNSLILAVALAGAVRFAVTPEGTFPDTWAGNRVHQGGLPAALSQRAVNHYLSQMDGKHIVLVHYLPSHDIYSEWVSNGYDIPSQKVAWAHDGGSDNANLDLFCAFRDHDFWYIEPDKNEHISDVEVAAVLHPVSTKGKCDDR